MVRDVGHCRESEVRGRLAATKETTEADVMVPRPDSHQRSRALPHPRIGSRASLAVAAVEVGLVAVAVVADVLLPTLVILGLMTVSLVLRGERLPAVGLRALGQPWRRAGQILALTLVWTVAQLALFMPLLERVTASRQDLSDFAGLRGDVGMLAVLLALSWTLAALGEELAYRGYLFTRVTNAVGSGTTGVVIAVLVSSLLFGLAHTEQGVVGVSLTFLDAVFFSVLRLRFASVWASVLAHGYNNTIGLVAFFLIGPVYALW